jgi:hypothetical protein
VLGGRRLSQKFTNPCSLLSQATCYMEPYCPGVRVTQSCCLSVSFCCCSGGSCVCRLIEHMCLMSRHLIMPVKTCARARAFIRFTSLSRGGLSWWP